MLRRKVSVSIPRVGEQFSSMPTPAPLYDAVDAPPLTHPQTTTSPDDDDVGSCATDIPATAAAIDGQTALESGAPTDVFDILDASGAHLSVLEMVQEPRQAAAFHSETPCLTEAALLTIAWPGERDRSRWIRRFQSTMHVPWDQSFERAVLLAAPKDEAELLDIVNGCAFHRMTVRVFYSGHNWSPLLVDTPNVSVSNKVDDSVVFVQLSATSFQRVSLVDAGIFNNARHPPIVTAGGGVGHEQFLKCLEQFSGGRHGIGYGMTHGPAPGDVSLVGTLAVGGHGTAVAIERERAIFGDHALYGTYSNRLIASRAIAWDSQTSRYIVKMYDRSSGSIDHLLTHFGRTIIVDVTMVVEHNCFMRCRSITDVSHEVLVPTQSATAVPAADAPLPERSVAWYVQRYGRVELLWFPFTEKPWLKVWEALDAEGLSAAKKDGSRYVETSYNYAMADRWLPEEITDIMSAITQVPAPSRRLHPGIPMATHAELAASSSGGLTRWPSVTRFVDAVRRLVPNTPEGHLARRVLGDLMCTGLTWILRSPLMTRALPVAGGPSPPLAAASADPGAVDPQVVPDVNLAAGRRAWRAPFVAASNMSPSMSPAAPMRRAKSAAHDRETSTPSTEDASPPAAEDEMPSPAARSPSPSALARFPDLSADAAQKNGTATAAAARATHASNPSVPLAAAAGSSSGNALWGGGMANAIAPQPGVRASLVRSASCCQTNAAARVALMTKLQGALVDRGLDATSTRDICGPSKAVTLYVNHHTVRVTANGYAVATTFQNINAVVDAACSIWRALLKEYAPDACPASQPFEIRVSGMDRPPPFLGHAASPPVSSALPGGNDEEDWDVVVWVDALAIPSARGLSQFFARFEDRLFAHPACCLPRAEIRPEWSKGFAYDATRGAWANEDVLARFRGLYPRWGECMKRLQEADPYDVFQTSWLRQFTRPEHE